MEKPMFYIIVPIFNVEGYLRQCLDSIQNQSYANFRAILVNDGSTDKSEEIAKIYAKNDERFSLHSQANQGLSNARNKALEIIKNILYAAPPQHTNSQTSNEAKNVEPKSYAIFVDSDDYLESNALQRLAEILSRNSVESLIINSAYYDDGTTQRLQVLFIPQESEIFNRIVSSAEVLMSVPKIHFYAMWVFVYECDFLFRHKLCFEPNILFEDILFATYAFSLTQRAMFTDIPLYHYRVVRKGSIMDTKDKNLHRVANSHFALAKAFHKYATCAKDEDKRAYLEHWSIFYVKETLRDIQRLGYGEKLDFSKSDITPFMPLLPMKYRFCATFPRIYGFPKRCRIKLMDFIKCKAGG